MAQGNPSWGECRNGGVFLRLPTPASPLVISDINKQIPSARRRWNSLTHVWWVHDNWIDTVEDILHKHYPDYDPYAGF